MFISQLMKWTEVVKLTSSLTPSSPPRASASKTISGHMEQGSNKIYLHRKLAESVPIISLEGTGIVLLTFAPAFIRPSDESKGCLTDSASLILTLR